MEILKASGIESTERLPDKEVLVSIDVYIDTMLQEFEINGQWKFTAELDFNVDEAQCQQISQGEAIS